MLKLSLVLMGSLFALTTVAQDEYNWGDYYRCGGYAMCQCIPSGPGSGMTCDYFSWGEGYDRGSAESSAKRNVLAVCEQECTRKTGRQCYNVKAANCTLIKP